MKKLIITSLFFISSLCFSQGITYDIYQNGVFKASTKSLTCTVSGLSPNKTYYFYIISRDAAGNKSPKSNTVYITTLSKPRRN